MMLPLSRTYIVSDWRVTDKLERISKEVKIRNYLSIYMEEVRIAKKYLG
jgi:hypothetical protein